MREGRSGAAAASPASQLTFFVSPAAQAAAPAPATRLPVFSGYPNAGAEYDRTIEPFTPNEGLTFDARDERDARRAFYWTGSECG